MMNVRYLAKCLVLVFLMLTSTLACAEDVLGYLTNKAGNYTGPSVEDNIIAMDKDKNGFADVFEVLAFLEAKHGIGYEKTLMDNWEASANGKSCSSPFAKALYSDKSNTTDTSNEKRQ